MRTFWLLVRGAWGSLDDWGLAVREAYARGWSEASVGIVLDLAHPLSVLLELGAAAWIVAALISILRG